MIVVKPREVQLFFISKTVDAIYNIDEISARHITSNNIENKIENETRICPFCSESIKKTAMVCRYCGKDLEKFDEEQKIKITEVEQIRKIEVKEKLQDINSLLKDELIYKGVKERRRIYGKKLAVEYLKEKALEAGINCEGVTEDNIDSLLGSH